jgi:hypothetical protein
LNAVIRDGAFAIDRVDPASTRETSW